MLRSNQDIKRTVQCALRSEFGFAPPLSSIAIYKHTPDGTHVLFAVNDKKYRFDSYVLNVGGLDTLYVGAGTIRRGFTS
nr:MAG TPA: Fantastic Four meristem regulator [Caudoviricetes sp.]